LVQKYVDVTVSEAGTECKSPASGPQTAFTDVVINGRTFLRESGSDAAAGQTYDWVGYSRVQGGDCVSLTFVLHSSSPGDSSTPRPTFDSSAESEIFSTIMTTFSSR
jgi:hypothetical protein